MTEREKVAARRKEVLSRGRKFKYPIQYAKHHIAIIATVISLVAVALLCILCWVLLYKANSSNDIIYRLTEVLPVPVASVDGESVRYSDYLLLYRSSIAVVAKDENYEATEAAYRVSALRAAEEYSYAIKLAREQGITVSDDEITDLFNEHLKIGGADRSKAAFLKILSDNFDVSESEYRRMLELLITKMKVASAIDDSAAELASKAEEAAKASGDLTAVANSLGADQVFYEDTGGLLDTDNVDGGRATVALSLEPGQVSDKFISSSGDAYYIVKLLEKTETQISYASLKIPLTEFEKRFNDVIENNNFSEFISLQKEEISVE